MRAKDWSASPLGPPESWRQSIKTAVSICLNSHFPILLWLGPELRLIYNDACIPFLGKTKHPAMLGATGREAWGEIWDTIGPMHEEVAAGRATSVDDQQVFFVRRLPREEVYLTLGCSPLLGDDGRTIEGVFCACMETTEKVVGERQLATLRALAARSSGQRTAKIASRHAAKVLGENPLDVPFAAIYLLDDEGTNARLAAATPLNDHQTVFPENHPVSDHGGPWPMGRVAKTGQSCQRIDLPATVGVFPAGPWPDPVQTALVLRLAVPTQPRPVGFLIIGVSPRRVLDADYCSFLDLAAGHIAASIADAQAFEAERKRSEALVKIDRAKTNVSHELRTPLTGAQIEGPRAEELASMSRLNQLSSRLTATSDLPSLLHEILDAAMELEGADFGDVQLYDRESQTLRIFAQRGFKREFLDHFQSVTAGGHSACGIALRDRRRVIVEDVLVDPDFAPHRQIAASAGFRAVHSTPLVERGTGSPVGVLSTHFRNPHRPSDRELRLTDFYAQQAADVIALRLSEWRLRESETRLKAAIDLVKLGCYAWNPQSKILEMDGRLKAMWGLPPDALVDYDVYRNAIHKDDLARVDAAVAARINPQQAGVIDIEFRVIGVTDGVERWVATRGSATFENDKPVAFFGVALDVTERKRTEQANLLLIAELQHRTRNLLGVVNAISAETLAASNSLDDFAATFGDRLAALSRVQGLLSRGNAPVTIGELVRLELQALGADPDGQRVTVEGPDVALPYKSVQVLALAVHELATNARKYGALAASEGRLSITWRTTDANAARCLALDWREHSTAVADGGAVRSARKGFGRTLIEDALPYQLDAQTQLEFGPDGVCCSVTMSLDP